MISTFTTAIAFLRCPKTICTKRGNSKKRQWILKTAPVCRGIPSESLHGQHTPATSRPQDRRSGPSTGPKKVSIARGAKTCYSSPIAIFRSHSTGTDYIYRTCIYYEVHTFMYYITVIVHICYMAILLARTTTVVRACLTAIMHKDNVATSFNTSMSSNLRICIYDSVRTCIEFQGATWSS